MGDAESKHEQSATVEHHNEWAPEPPRAKIRLKNFRTVLGFCCWCYTINLPEGPSPGSKPPAGTYGLTLDPGVEIINPDDVDQTGLSPQERDCLKYSKGQLHNGRGVIWKEIGKDEAASGEWTFCFLSTCGGSTKGSIGVAFRSPDGHTARVSTPTPLPGPK
jgi:hypothetical protein